MTKFDIIPGFTGSEIERATLAGGIFPTESAVERAIKKQLAKGLALLANKLDPTIIGRHKLRATREQYC